MRRAILLVYDEPEKKLVKVKRTGFLKFILDLLPFLEREEDIEVDCFCLKNNSIDRAKILIRYLRKQLKFRDDQITLLRGSRFGNSAEILTALGLFFKKYPEDDILLYYVGHGITSPKFGWSIGPGKYILYKFLKKIFSKFSGRLVFINDCCHALAVDQHLRILAGRYLLFGACRKGCTASESILDPVLGYWFHRKLADPKVAHTGKLKDTIMDIPAYASRGSNFNCGCGSRFHPLKFFRPSNAPSLRRGSELDHIFFADKPET